MMELNLKLLARTAGSRGECVTNMCLIRYPYSRIYPFISVILKGPGRHAMPKSRARDRRAHARVTVAHDRMFVLFLRVVTSAARAAARDANGVCKGILVVSFANLKLWPPGGP